jgi:hypothetical protein
MATSQLTNITPPRVPLLDPKTNLISREWYRFFLNLFVLTGSGQNTASLTDLQLGPPMPTQEDFGEVVIDIESAQKQPTQESALDQIAELQKQIDGLKKQIECPCTELTAELQKQIEGLQMTPPPRQFERSRYGSFYDTTTQTATTINTAKAVTFNNTDLTNGVYLGTPTSRVYVDTPGIYNFDTSFQLDKTAGGVGLFYLWFRLNGVDVPDSASQIRIQGNNAEIFSSLNYFFDLNAGDYVEIMYSVDDLSVQILAEAAAAPHPGIPSIILTVSNNIGGIQ